MDFKVKLLEWTRLWF